MINPLGNPQFVSLKCKLMKEEIDKKKKQQTTQTKRSIMNVIIKQS